MTPAVLIVGVAFGVATNGYYCLGGINLNVAFEDKQRVYIDDSVLPANFAQNNVATNKDHCVGRQSLSIASKGDG